MYTKKLIQLGLYLGNMCHITHKTDSTIDIFARVFSCELRFGKLYVDFIIRNTKDSNISIPIEEIEDFNIIAISETI